MEKELHLPFPPISDQRTVFLVNTFVIHTVRLLNNFAVICEDKLADVHRRILRTDATLSLLEAKLRSVDGLEGTREQLARASQPDLAFSRRGPQSPEPQQSTSELSRANSVAIIHTSDRVEFVQVKDDPKYARFFRMLHVGVPLPAVKIQMSVEGLDGSVLDNPEVPSSEKVFEPVES